MSAVSYGESQVGATCLLAASVRPWWEALVSEGFLGQYPRVFLQTELCLRKWKLSPKVYGKTCGKGDQSAGGEVCASNPLYILGGILEVTHSQGMKIISPSD